MKVQCKGTGTRKHQGTVTPTITLFPGLNSPCSGSSPVHLRYGLARPCCPGPKKGPFADMPTINCPSSRRFSFHIPKGENLLSTDYSLEPASIPRHHGLAKGEAVLGPRSYDTLGCILASYKDSSPIRLESTLGRPHFHLSTL